jgi:hypothetical protein
MSLVRAILLAIEAHPPGQGPADIQVPGFAAGPSARASVG